MLRNGFTLIELIITLAISAILIGTSVPSLLGLYNRTLSDAHIGTLLAIINHAREYAITHNTHVYICGSNTGLSCEKTWQRAIVAFIDKDADKTLTDKDEVLVMHQFTRKQGYFYSRIASGMHVTAFNALGSAKYAGSFVYCAPNNKHNHRATWNRLGRSYKGQDKNNDGYIDDTNKKSITCI